MLDHEFAMNRRHRRKKKSLDSVIKRSDTVPADAFDHLISFDSTVYDSNEFETIPTIATQAACHVTTGTIAFNSLQIAAF